MASGVIHADLELFLVGWYRTQIAALVATYPVLASLQVDRVEPDPTQALPAKYLVIRDDSGPTIDFVTAERAIGLSILAGTREKPDDALDIGRIIAALLFQIPSGDPANPVARVDSVNGPYLIDEEQPRARAYLTAQLVVAGSPF